MRKITAIKRRKVVDNYLLFRVFFFCNLNKAVEEVTNEFKVVKF